MTRVAATYQTQSWLHFLKKLRRDLVAKHFALQRTTCTYPLKTSWSRACVCECICSDWRGTKFKDNKSLPQQMRWGLRSPWQRGIKHLLAAGEKLEWKTQNSNQTRCSWHRHSVSIMVLILDDKWLKSKACSTQQGACDSVFFGAPAFFTCGLSPLPFCSLVCSCVFCARDLSRLLLYLCTRPALPVLFWSSPPHPDLVRSSSSQPVTTVMLVSFVYHTALCVYFSVFFYAPFRSVPTVFSSPPCTFWTSLPITNLWLAGRRERRGCHRIFCRLYISLSGSSQPPARVGTTSTNHCRAGGTSHRPLTSHCADPFTCRDKLGPNFTRPQKGHNKLSESYNITYVLF